MTARLLRPFNIDIAHKPTQNLEHTSLNTKTKRLQQKSAMQFTWYLAITANNITLDKLQISSEHD